MSADNWDICPRCLARAQKAEQEQRAATAASYGIVTMEEFGRMQAEIKTPDPESFRTFREDYAIRGAAEGVVRVTYRGHCEVCGLNLAFADDHPMPPED